MPVPIIGLAGFSGSGKTTLLRQLITRFSARGYRVAVIKHTHHEFDIDHPGKDSYELRHAGAARIVVGSARRWALIVERSAPAEATLVEMLTVISPETVDLVFVEGFRDEKFPKIEVHRPSLGRAVLAHQDDSIIAIATDATDLDSRGLPRLDLNDVDAVETFVHAYLAPTLPS